jgi:hypothetical protein
MNANQNKQGMIRAFQLFTYFICSDPRNRRYSAANFFSRPKRVAFRSFGSGATDLALELETLNSKPETPD